MSDIAVLNATREKVVLTLAIDSDITNKAFEASRLYLAWSEAGKKLEEFKSEFRVYASKNRNIWNEANNDKVTTVKIPFKLKTDRGIENRYISVSCTSSYTTDPIILNKMKREFPIEYKELFVEEQTTVLRPRGKEILRNQLKSSGLDDSFINKLFKEVFSNEITIKPIENFEFKKDDVLKNAPDLASKYLELGVKRALASVSFETK